MRSTFITYRHRECRDEPSLLGDAAMMTRCFSFAEEYRLRFHGTGRLKLHHWHTAYIVNIVARWSPLKCTASF